MILGYFGVPIYMTAKGPFKRLREARERTESKRANRELQQALETAVSAIGGAVAGAVVARSGPDPLPPSSNGPTGPGYSFRVVPPWEGPSVIYGQPHRYPRSAQIDAPGVVEGQVRPIIDDPTRQLPDPSQPPGNSGTAGGSPGRNPSGGVPKTLNTAEFFEDLRRRRQANQNQSQSPSASAADSEPPVIQINSRQLIREQTQPPPPAQKREIDKGKVAGITAGGLKILGIGAGAVHPLLGTATNLVATGFEGYANKKAANQKAAESTQSEGVPKTLTLQQMYELLRQQKGGQSRA
jgi:hypothetical protein